MTDILYLGEGSTKPIACEDVLDTTFRTMGTAYGYEKIEAAFVSCKEFKSTWQRLGKSVSFEISDYLGHARPEILGDFAQALYDRIDRRTHGCVYSSRLKAYLESDDFVRRNQATYLKRSRNLVKDSRGQRFDLKETYDRLVDSGIVSPSTSVSLNWTRSENRMRVGYCSVLMRVVAISSLLDNEKVPDFVHEYVLYHELLHLEDGLSDGHRHHPPEFKAREREHPKWRESEEWLHRMAARKVDLA
ncbi:MAG: hypothetical protein SA339_07455 [Methanomassiliicoccus sp.]|nr:hypothetical protein [Methanomassiliicoccus sp.]